MSGLSNILAGYWRVASVRRGIAWGVVLGAVAASLYQSAYLPEARKFEDLRRGLLELSDEKLGFETRKAQVDEFELLSGQLDQVFQKFTAQADRSKIVERLAAMAEQAGVRIIHGSNNFGKAQEGFVPVEQTLTIEGGYAQVHAFLQDLALIETFTLIEKIELTANQEGSLVRAALELVTFNEASKS